MTPIEDLAAAGCKKLRDQVEARALACTIRADQGMDGTLSDVDIHLRDRAKAMKVLRQLSR